MLLDLLDDAVSNAEAVFLPDNRRLYQFEIWELADRYAAVLQDLVRSNTVAGILSSTPESIAAFYGAIKLGARFVSLPTPPRAASLGWYLEFISSAMSAEDADLLLRLRDRNRDCLRTRGRDRLHASERQRSATG